MSHDGYTYIAESAYPGRCAGCGDPYELGDPIWWRRGGPCYHEDCAPDAAEATPVPAGGTRTATARERETGAERTLRDKIAALDAAMAEAQRANAATIRAVAGLMRTVVALADALGGSGVLAEPLAEVETALRSLTDPHADAAAAQAAGTGGAHGDAVPF
jgi:hypothetical protein